MKSTIYLFIVAVFFVAACSSGVKITSSHEDVDFSQYATFKILPVEYGETDRIQNMEDNKQIIRKAIIGEMEALNFTVDDSNPDVMIYATVTIMQEEQKRERTIQDGPYYMGQRNFSWSASDSILVGYYDEGALQVNMVDVEKNKLVWHGTAKKALREHPKDREEKIQEAVAEIFEEYPGNPNPPTSMK